MVSKSTQIIRKLAGDKATIFNDKLADGRRSYKVWGWDYLDYEKAWAYLVQGGIKSEVVYARAYWCQRRADVVQNVRIHVG
jgi:hypothetical protein